MRLMKGEQGESENKKKGIDKEERNEQWTSAKEGRNTRIEFLCLCVCSGSSESSSLYYYLFFQCIFQFLSSSLRLCYSCCFLAFFFLGFLPFSPFLLGTCPSYCFVSLFFSPLAFSPALSLLPPYIKIPISACFVSLQINVSPECKRWKELSELVECLLAILVRLETTTGGRKRKSSTRTR